MLANSYFISPFDPNIVGVMVSLRSVGGEDALLLAKAAPQSGKWWNCGTRHDSYTRPI
jgi:hypothetical protein